MGKGSKFWCLVLVIGILLSLFTACEEETAKVRIDWSGFASGDGVTAEYRFVDTADDNNAVRVEETFFGDTGAHIFTLPLYTTILVTLKK